MPEDPNLDVEPFLAPEPEGPEVVSARMLRLRRSRTSIVVQRFLEVTGLQGHLSAKTVLLYSFAIAEFILIGLNIFTDISIPLEWIATPALALVAYLFHRGNSNEGQKHPKPEVSL